MVGSLNRRSQFGATMDKLALLAIIIVISALYFYRMTRSALISLALTLTLFSCVIAAFVLYKRTPFALKHSTRLKRAAAGIILDQMALKPHGEAETELLSWIASAYPLTDITRTSQGLCASWQGQRILARLSQKHATDSVTGEEIIALWRDARDINAFGTLALSTSHASPAALKAARELSAPFIKVFDRDALIATALPYLRIVKPPNSPKVPLRERVRTIVGKLINHSATSRYFIYGTSLTMIYVATGMSAALPCAVIILGLGMVSLKTPRVPKSLF